MDSRSAACMGTYLGMVLALTLIGALVPWLSGPIILLGWAVSATYLHLMPLRTWAQSRLIIDAFKLPSHYRQTVEFYGAIESIKMGGVAIISKIALDAAPLMSEEENMIINHAITHILSIPTHNLTILMPFIGIATTYIGIGVIYIYLHRVGFYRRILL